ncbi:MAG: polysaccharide deacetylase family protein [Bacilli bacterium]
MDKKINLCLLLILNFIVIFTSTIENNNISTSSSLIYYGDVNSNKIYLTFDDGYPYKNTKKIVETLIEYNIPATFFFEGDFLCNHQNFINYMIDNNLTIGCHTIDHKNIDKKTNQQFLKDLDKYEKAYKEITNKELLPFFRPPQGKIDDAKTKLLKERGYLIFMWSLSYYDYNPYDELGADYAYQYITKNTEGGYIILLHTLTKSNVQALERIIITLQNKGFIFSSLTDFL